MASEASTQSACGVPAHLLDGDTPVTRIGYGAMQLAGPGVWGRPGAQRVWLAAMRSRSSSGMMDRMSLRAVIVDDNAEFLQTARSLLERGGITVVGIASTGVEALRSAEQHDPDVVLVDVGLGDESGFDVAERLDQVTGLGTGRRRRVVLISARAEEDLVDLIEASPAIGFVPKSRLSADAIINLLHVGDLGGADGTRLD
jgi:CheY-like chemotaxis protein